MNRNWHLKTGRSCLNCKALWLQILEHNRNKMAVAVSYPSPEMVLFGGRDVEVQELSKSYPHLPL